MKQQKKIKIKVEQDIRKEKEKEDKRIKKGQRKIRLVE